MTKKHEISQRGVTEISVGEGGTLTLTDFFAPKKRSEFDLYEGFDYWSKSPANLAQAMAECEPLAWAVHSIYSDVRDDIEAELEDATDNQNAKKNAALLKALLKGMPEEPEDGAEAWLLSMTDSDFEQRVVPEIKQWFDSEPDWGGYENDYLESQTAQGAALGFFNTMSRQELNSIGVIIVEGQFPGSTYFAAELRIDIFTANKAAADAGILVRFKSKEL